MRKKLARLNLPPSANGSDGEFIRRAYLDAAGILPTPEEVHKFVADKEPAKRKQLINELLKRPELAHRKVVWDLECERETAKRVGCVVKLRVGGRIDIAPAFADDVYERSFGLRVRRRKLLALLPALLELAECHGCQPCLGNLMPGFDLLEDTDEGFRAAEAQPV